MKKQTWKLWIGTAAGAGAFIAASLFAQHYGEVLANLPYTDWRGMLVYVLVGIITTVIAPLTSIPLLPIAVRMWGPFIAGALSVIGWGIGSLIAFWIARRYGERVVRFFVSESQLRYIQQRFSGATRFWPLVFLRMSVPVDVLSYAIGVFTHVSFSVYFWSTLIGIIPFAFILSYIGSMPPVFQVVVLGVALGLLYLYYQRNGVSKE